MSLPYPFIVVPGITATYLKDMYTLPPDFVWTVLSKKFERITLHPKNLSYEAKEPAMVTHDQVFEVAYRELIEELREELKDIAGDEVPVYPFGYDWRQPLEVNQQRLAVFIDEVIARTRLMPHYAREFSEDDEIKVNLIGHSMGGLVISRYLTDNPDSQKVNKVATLATPFQGSFEAVVKLTVGAGNLTGSKPSHAERRSARVTPAVYQLLPGFKAGITIDSQLGAGKTLFDSDVWQPSVTESIQKFINDLDYPQPISAEDVFDQMLAYGGDSFAEIKNLDLTNHGLTDKDWLAIVGVDCDTRIQQNVEVNDAGEPMMTFSKQDVQNKWKNKATGKAWRKTGDSTVPFEGAVPPFLSEDNLVLITPDDYGFWEVQDKALTKLAGFHGILPNMNLVHRLLIRFFTDADDKYKNTWGRHVPNITKDKWNPPIDGLKPEN